MGSFTGGHPSEFEKARAERLARPRASIACCTTREPGSMSMTCHIAGEPDSLVQIDFPGINNDVLDIMKHFWSLRLVESWTYYQGGGSTLWEVEGDRNSVMVIEMIGRAALEGPSAPV